MSAKLLCLATMEPVISLCGSLGSAGALCGPRSVIRQTVQAAQGPARDDGATSHFIRGIMKRTEAFFSLLVSRIHRSV